MRVGLSERWARVTLMTLGGLVAVGIGVSVMATGTDQGAPPARGTPVPSEVAASSHSAKPTRSGAQSAGAATPTARASSAAGAVEPPGPATTRPAGTRAPGGPAAGPPQASTPPVHHPPTHTQTHPPTPTPTPTRTRPGTPTPTPSPTPTRCLVTNPLGGCIVPGR